MYTSLALLSLISYYNYHVSWQMLQLLLQPFGIVWTIYRNWNPPKNHGKYHHFPGRVAICSDASAQQEDLRHWETHSFVTHGRGATFRHAGFLVEFCQENVFFFFSRGFYCEIFECCRIHFCFSNQLLGKVHEHFLPRISNSKMCCWATGINLAILTIFDQSPALIWLIFWSFINHPGFLSMHWFDVYVVIHIVSYYGYDIEIHYDLS